MISQRFASLNVKTLFFRKNGTLANTIRVNSSRGRHDAAFCGSLYSNDNGVNNGSRDIIVENRPMSSSGPTILLQAKSNVVSLTHSFGAVSFFSTSASSRRKETSSILDQSADDDGLVKKPSNLIFDVRSTVSPFRGMDKVEVEYVDEEDDTKEPTATETVASKPKEEEDDVDDYDDDEIEEWFDATTRPEPKRAIPLPQRLHVDVHQFYDPFESDDAKESTATTTKVGTIHLSKDVFGCDPIRTDILQRVVQYQRNKKRGVRYPAKSKTITEVSGSGKKVRPQKGGGTARAGHKRPPHWRGGAKAHGPKGIMQDYTTKLNKKVRKMGVRMALSQKLLEQNLIVVDELIVPTHRTAPLNNLLYERFGISGRHGTTAVILDDADSPIDPSDFVTPVEQEMKSSQGETSDEEESAKVADKGSTADTESESGSDSSTTMSPERLVLHGVNANLKVASGNLHKVLLTNQSDASVWEILRHEKLVLSLSAIRSLEKRLAP